MMKSMILILVVALISSSAARHVKWTMNEDVVDATTPFNFKFVLAQQNLDVLDSMFWQISDPHSPLFGKFLTNEQIADLISLPEADIQAVENYIKKDAGKFCDVEVKRNVHRDYLYVSTCVGQAQVMFPNLKLSVYERENSVQTVLRSKRLLQDVSSNLHFLGVPHELHHLISGIHDVTDTPVPVEHVSKTFDPFLPWQKSDKELTIAEMRETFNVTWDGIEDSTLEEDDGQVRQAVVEFFHNNFSSSELAAYQQKYGMPINPIRKVVGTQNFSEENSVEASLDVQTITGISGNVHTWDFVFGDSLCWLDMVETVTTTPGAPKVLSCSWGNFESLVNKSKVAPVNAAFMKLGLAGFTFLIAAGDSGPSLQQNCEYYDPQFPATSPYVVSVGGTKIDKTTGVEGAWFNSSGGFSFLVDRPDFQQEKVAAYLDKAKMPPNAGGKVYNTVGRAFPDVSAFGAYQPVLANGTYQPVGGTSSATPQFTAVLALINIHRYQKGLGPLGPLTQTFWTLEKGVGFDVTVGSSYATFNQGGDTCKDVYLPGYETLPGWDPVTGIGSPKFDVLLEQLLNIPGESK